MLADVANFNSVGLRVTSVVFSDLSGCVVEGLNVMLSDTLQKLQIPPTLKAGKWHRQNEFGFLWDGETQARGILFPAEHNDF